MMVVLPILEKVVMSRGGGVVEDIGPRWWHYPLGYRSTVT